MRTEANVTVRESVGCKASVSGRKPPARCELQTLAMPCRALLIIGPNDKEGIPMDRA